MKASCVAPFDTTKHQLVQWYLHKYLYLGGPIVHLLYLEFNYGDFAGKEELNFLNVNLFHETIAAMFTS